MTNQAQNTDRTLDLDRQADALIPFVRKIFEGGFEGFAFDRCPMMGSWSFRRVGEAHRDFPTFFTTPFFEGSKGIPVDVYSVDGEVAVAGELPFFLTDDAEQDAADLVALIVPTLRRLVRTLEKIATEETGGDVDDAVVILDSRI